MAKKQKPSVSIYLIIAVTLLLVLGIIYYLKISKNYTQTINQNIINSQSSNSILFPEPPIQIPSQWKSNKELFKNFNFTLSYKYPSDWIIKSSTGGGHPNYATLYSSDMKQCIKFTISQDYKNTDQEIANAISEWGEQIIPQNSIVNSQDIVVNGKQGKIEQLDYKNQKFFIGALDLNIDRKPDTVFAVLSTCSLEEQQIFNKVLSSITIN